MNTWADLESTWAAVGSTWQSIFLPPLEPSTGNVRVELGLQRAFILDDTVAGVIGGTDYVLSGEDFVDISSFAYNVSTSRGKNTELDKYKAGSVSVGLRNQNRYFDPKYVQSPFAGELVPRRGIRVLVDSVPVFTGRVADWNVSYRPGTDSVAEVEGVDNFALLASQFLTAGTVIEQDTGARIEAVLNMPSVDWPVDDRRLDTGQSTLGSAIVDGTENALLYLQEVELSEIGGSLFISREGYLVFKDRTSAPQVESAVLFADDSSGVPFVDVAVEYGTENLFNQITVSSPAGTAIANDIVSQQQFGISAAEYQTLLSDQQQLDNAALFLIGQYSRPVLRFKTLTVDMALLNEAERNSVLGLELADVAEIKLTPNGIGDPVQEFGIVIGINHDINPASHRIQFSFAPILTNPFIIGDAEFGIIGADAPGVLGY